MFLMLKNTKVMYFDLEDFVVEVIREDLLPFAIRSNITSASKPKDILHNIQAVKSLLSTHLFSEYHQYLLHLLPTSCRHLPDEKSSIQADTAL